MLFSSPDYPVFLIAVFFLYALSRWGSASVRGWARIALMVVLGDLIFLLVSKDPDTLWDPLGQLLLRGIAATTDAEYTGISPALMAKWPVGLAVLGGAIWLGRVRGGWIAGRGQAVIARGLVGVLVLVGATVAIGEATGTLDRITVEIVANGHLLVLFVLGVGLGAVTIDQSRPLGRVIVLFVASSLFYHAWAAAMPGPYRYLLALLLATIVLDYYLGIWIEETEDPWRRKALVIVSLCSNLGILFFFKYADFFSQDVLHLPVKRMDLILPAGISFHTFQSLSYTIDVYRKQLKATRSVIQFATFVLFFPQLVAGPIVRAQDLLPQLEQLPPLEQQAATRGLFRIVVGLFKKIALADTLALTIADRVFDNPERFSTVEVLLGVYAYALQIYLDFSAYSDIAIGSAQVLGFELPENFRTPYRSANLQEFWRRWHISLSTWLKDYLYITLGGSRGAEWRTYVNLLLTMLLGGLWHGASWAFIVWGALHGFGLAVTRYFQRATAKDPTAGPRIVGKLLGVAVAGFVLQRLLLFAAGTWWQLVAAWLYLTPLWAALTAWLGADVKETPAAPVLETDEGGPWRGLFKRSRALADEPASEPQRWSSRAAPDRDVRERGRLRRDAALRGQLDVAADAAAGLGARARRGHRRDRARRRARAVGAAREARDLRGAGVPLRVPRVDLLPGADVRRGARRAAPARDARDRSRERDPDADARPRDRLPLSLLPGPDVPLDARAVLSAPAVRTGPGAVWLRAAAARAVAHEDRAVHLLPVLSVRAGRDAPAPASRPGWPTGRAPAPARDATRRRTWRDRSRGPRRHRRPR